MVYSSVIADSYHFDEEQDPDPYENEKLTLLVVVGWVAG
jgi:hypothetical protein